MFDANMRHLPKGLEFFAEAWSIAEGSKLSKLGYKSGDLIHCKMLSKGNKNPAILVENQQVTNEEDFYDTTLVFMGCLDGTSFYNDPEFKAKALAYLGGTWNT